MSGKGKYVPPQRRNESQSNNNPKRNFPRQSSDIRNNNFQRRGDPTRNNHYNNKNHNNRFGSTTPNPELEAEIFGERRVAQGIKFDEYDKIPVEVSGRDMTYDISNGIQEFDALHPRLTENIKKCNFNKPTPIQKHSVPTVLNDRDLMACAQTGSGKTAAFLIPTVQCLLTKPKSENHSNWGRAQSMRFHPRAVVLAPTRELAQQIHAEARKFLYCTGMRTVCIYGGASIRDQFKDLEKGVSLLVATPGRLWDMVERKSMSFQEVEFVILDEADRMLDMGFEPQIRKIICESDMPDSKNRRTLMYSATFPNEIQRLAQEFLNDYVFIAVGRVGSTTQLITQQLQNVMDPDKRNTLLGVLEECTRKEGQILVFTATKRTADQVTWLLNNEGYHAVAIHGDKDQKQREDALKCFREGVMSILVATDVAARGLDIPNVLYVIQYDLPSNIDDYVHRIGRTGRRGNSGIAISFVNPSNRSIFQDLLNLLHESKQKVPTWFSKMCASAEREREFRRGGMRSGRPTKHLKAGNYTDHRKEARQKKEEKKNPEKSKKRVRRKKKGYSCQDAW